MTSSAIYEGTVRHRRFAVRPGEFRHRIALVYLDLTELDEVLGGRLVAERPGLVRFRRSDYLGDNSQGLADAVRAQVRRSTGQSTTGPVRVLTQLRTLGHCFNPVSFYYCFSPDEQLQAVVAEVTNTPWGERHAYVLGRGAEGPVLAAAFAKQLHVSPFMPMEQSYLWRVATPGSTLSVQIDCQEQGQCVFDATLALQRAPLTRTSLAAISARYPATTLRTLTLIYGHAAALKLKGVPVHPHPSV